MRISDWISDVCSSYLETPFFQGAYQPVYARFRFEPERLLHLLERGGDTARFQPLLDEVEQFLLLRGQHFGVSMLPTPDIWRTIVEQSGTCHSTAISSAIAPARRELGRAHV